MVRTTRVKANLDRLLDRPSGYSSGKDDGVEGGGVGNLAQDVSYLWRAIPAPVIASLHGACFGGGLQIALGADLRFSTPDCKISIMEGKYGLIPDMSASITLRELIRMDVAKELTMTGRVISGEEAATLGLVTRCITDPMEESLRVAREIRERSPDAVASAKRMFQETWTESDEEKCLRRETELQLPLLASWNQMAAAGRGVLGVRVPYGKRRDVTELEGGESR